MNRKNEQSHFALHVIDNSLHRTGAVNYQGNVEAATPQATDKTTKASADPASVARTNPTAAPDPDSAARHRAHIVCRFADRLSAVLGDDWALDRHRHRHFRNRHFRHIELLDLLSAAATTAGL